jgi:S1-C subfamily serine protease
MMNRLSVDKGAIITRFAPSSPALAAGLQRLDIIVGFNDKEITTAGELIQAYHSSQIGEEVKITFIRGQNTMVTHVRLAASQPPTM